MTSRAIEFVPTGHGGAMATRRVVGLFKFVWLMDRVPGYRTRSDPSEGMWLLSSVEGAPEVRPVIVGAPELDGTPVVVTDAPWRLSLQGCRVDLAAGSRRRSGTADLVTDRDDVVHIVHALITDLAGQQGLRKAGALVGAKLRARRVPTIDEIRAALLDTPRDVVRITTAGARP